MIDLRIIHACRYVDRDANYSPTNILWQSAGILFSSCILTNMSLLTALILVTQYLILLFTYHEMGLRLWAVFFFTCCWPPRLRCASPLRGHTAWHYRCCPSRVLRKLCRDYGDDILFGLIHCRYSRALLSSESNRISQFTDHQRLRLFKIKVRGNVSHVMDEETLKTFKLSFLISFHVF